MGGGRTGFGPVKRRRAILLLYLSVLRATFYRVGRNDRENRGAYSFGKIGGGIVVSSSLAFHFYNLPLSVKRNIFPFHLNESRWNWYFIFNSVSLLFDKLETKDILIPRVFVIIRGGEKFLGLFSSWNIQFHFLLLPTRKIRRRKKREVKC